MRLGPSLGLNAFRRPAASLVIPARYAPYVDDFETSGLLSARPNWTILNPVSVSHWKTTGGYLYHDASDDFGAGQYPHGIILYGPDGGFGADLYARFGYNKTPSGWDPNNQDYRFWAKDASNYVTFGIDSGNLRLVVVAIVNGNTAAFVQFDITPADAARTVGNIELEVKDAKVRVRLDGVWLTNGQSENYQYVDLSAVPVANRVGKIGIRADGNSYRLIDYIEGKSLDVSFDSFDQAIGRNSLTGNAGTATAVMRFAGFTPTQWVYRVLGYATGSVVADWRVATGVTVSGSQATVPISVPMGLQVVEAGYIGNDGLLHVVPSRPILCGHRILTYGQSNSDGRNQPADANTITINPLVAAYKKGSQYGGQVQTAGRYAYQGEKGSPPCSYALGTTIQGQINEPVVVQSCGHGAASINELSPGGTWWNEFLSDLAGGKGIVEAIVWDQGEADTVGNTAGYSNTFLNSLLPGLRSATGNANLPVLISMIGRYAVSGTANASDNSEDVLRQQYLLCTADPYVTIASSKLGCTHINESGSYALHYTKDTYGYIEICRRDGLSVAKSVFGVAHDGRGGLVSSASRNGATLTLGLNLNGSTGLAGSLATRNTGPVPTQPVSGGLYGYQVSADNFASLLTINSLTVNGNLIVLTLSAAPSGPVKVRSMYDSSYDDTTLVVCNYSDTGPIPVFPILTPITSN